MSEAAATTMPERECDLVMKGGITSGVVYPRAIKKIAEVYAFRNLGGASAGAIAAVAAAACEYRRNEGVPDAYDILDDVSKEISQQGFVESLFQPTEKARPAYTVGLQLATTSGTLERRLPRAITAILKARGRFLVGAALAVLGWAWILGFALVAGGTDALEIVWLVVAFLIGAVLLVAATALVALSRFLRELDASLKANFLGMCSGRTEEGAPGPALTDWLYSTIQRCAGRGLDEPLSFRDLQGPDPKDPQVNLQLITTDLSSSRPVTIPFPEPAPEEKTPYLFDPKEFRRLFPEQVVDHMVEKSPGPVGGERELYPVPGLDLPIVVAARLSLSFPILLSTVPLWKQDGPQRSFVQHTMSDGGICSNFPIHFFDSLFPGRPTFGLDLQPWRLPTQKPVEMSDRPRRPGFSKVGDIGTFFTQLLNAARNWRDNTQAELPGYRDRICQIRLTEREGGLNLNMPDDVVKGLLQRGEDAGAVVTDPQVFDWNRHRVTRFWIFMQMLQRGLGPLGVGRPGVYRGTYPRRFPFRDTVLEWQTAGSSPFDRPELAWWKPAIEASDALLELANTWDPAGSVDFDAGAPTPTPTIRILPRI